MLGEDNCWESSGSLETNIICVTCFIIDLIFLERKMFLIDQIPKYLLLSRLKNMF